MYRFRFNIAEKNIFEYIIFYESYINIYIYTIMHMIFVYIYIYIYNLLYHFSIRVNVFYINLFRTKILTITLDNTGAAYYTRVIQK